MASDSQKNTDSKPQAKPKASIVVASPRTQSPKDTSKAKRRIGRFFSTPGGIASAFSLFLAFYLSLTLWLASIWPEGWAFLVRPGILLKSSFAWASWFLPLWILCAGIMAALPKAHPRFAYILAASALPFLVLAGFARISTEPGPFFENQPIFAAVGLSSLYAGFGFLFALAVGLVGFGFFRLTLWMRATGKLSDKKAVKSAKGGTTGPKGKKLLPWVVLGNRISAWNKARKEKKSQAERRLDSAQAIAAKPFDFEVPRLPTLGELRSQENAPEPEHSLDPAPAALRVTSPASEKPIEFISVPPQTVTGESGAIKDEEKSALIQRILDRKKEKPYTVPVDGILNTYPDGKYWVIDDKTRLNAEVLTETLAEFKIEAEVTGISKGPVITMYEILPAHGVKISKITNLADNIALRLAASSVRIVAPIPGKHAVGIEVPNAHRSVVSLREIIEHEQFRTAKMAIPIALGKDIQGVVQFTDLNQMPHLLIAGATGSGKSVCVNALILSILYRRSPEEVKLILIDPKIVELKLYNGIPHLLTPVITEPKKAFQALQYCIFEMQRRYSMLSKLDVRDISTYNKKIKDQSLAQEKLPFLVVVIDEFASLMANSGKELEDTLHKISALARAVGIHLVLATQRPSVDVITGLIKANIPARIAFMVSSKFDSRVIIDMVGAEKLLGKGDMLYSGSTNPFPIRMQCAFVSEEEVERAVAHVKTLGEPEYIDDEIFYDEEEEELEPSLFDDGEGDPLFEKALEIVLQQGKASASYIQRRLKIGYNRSARLVELMEERGIVGPAQGSKPRDVIQNPDHIPRGLSKEG
ncbi:MAG: DNA segregation ATPase FtsK/SpoIIIE S-DNA-T family [Spirochaetes bacterium]|nr:MAG: DNA segregation ATPase FtsK/SpoIIIE S-DNA-T family [Spirochaetota bacterium]